MSDSQLNESDVSKVARHEALRERSWNDNARFGAVIVFPVVIALLGTSTPALWNYHPAIPFFAWIILLLIYCLFWWKATPSSVSFLSMLLRNGELENELSTKQQYVEALETSEIKQSQKSLAAFNLRKMSVSYIEQGISNKDGLGEMLSDVLAPLYLTGGQLLGFLGTESWSLSVYLYSKTQDKLVPIWREKSRNHPSQGKSRSWGRGEGHVGKAFVDRETIFTADASDGEVAKLVEAKGDNKRSYDQIAYRSFASIPFGVFGSQTQGLPIGVVVGTSNEPNRFNLESTELAQHFAETLGVILSLTHFDVDILSNDSNIEKEQGVNNGQD